MDGPSRRWSRLESGRARRGASRARIRHSATYPPGARLPSQATTSRRILDPESRGALMRLVERGRGRARAAPPRPVITSGGGTFAPEAEAPSRPPFALRGLIYRRGPLRPSRTPPSPAIESAEPLICTSRGLGGLARDAQTAKRAGTHRERMQGRRWWYKRQI